MTTSARQFLKQNAPPQIKNLVKRVRGSFAPPPMDDTVLADYRFAPDPTSTARLTYVVPNLSPEEAFGGVTTGIDVFLNLAAGLRASRPLDLRLVLTDHDQSTTPAIFTSRAEAAGFDPAAIAVEKVRAQDNILAIRAQEIFVTYNWWATLNVNPLLERQAAHFGQAPKPLLYLIQEYEPAMYAFSSAQMLAREAYDAPERLWGIFNSGNLRSYFELQGHSTERGWTFEPVVNDSLRPYLDAAATSSRKPQIIVYGRPSINRNCFPALVRGLRHWASHYPQFADWQVVSAGTAHDPVELGDGRQIRSLGKLSLDEYASLLLESSVGISLMASPHPSYPPLEMVHFGLRVVTNSYTCKDLGPYHPNMLSLPAISAAALAAGIAKACAQAAAPPSDYRNPEFVRAEKYPFMADLVSAVHDAIGA